jgi:hypothetical protein
MYVPNSQQYAGYTLQPHTPVKPGEYRIDCNKLMQTTPGEFYFSVMTKSSWDKAIEIARTLAGNSHDGLYESIDYKGYNIRFNSWEENGFVAYISSYGKIVKLLGVGPDWKEGLDIAKQHIDAMIRDANIVNSVKQPGSTATAMSDHGKPVGYSIYKLSKGFVSYITEYEDGYREAKVKTYDPAPLGVLTKMLNDNHIGFMLKNLTVPPEPTGTNGVAVLFNLDDALKTNMEVIQTDAQPTDESESAIATELSTPVELPSPDILEETGLAEELSLPVIEEDFSEIQYSIFIFKKGVPWNPTRNDFTIYIYLGGKFLKIITSDTLNSTIDMSKVWADNYAGKNNISKASPEIASQPTARAYSDAPARKIEDTLSKLDKMAEDVKAARIAGSQPMNAIMGTSRSSFIPPKTITMKQYSDQYEPNGWKLLIIGPTATWRQEWHEWEAIRDIVQNALDEGEAYTFGYDNDGLWIADSGKGIRVSDFLLGPATLKPDYARGKFGEGMKVSALVLTRLGYRVHVRTADKDIWILFVEQDVGGSVAETLAAIWKFQPYQVGTKFSIVGYKGDSFADKFANNIPAGLIVQQTPSSLNSPIPRFNRIYKATAQYPARLFARDIYLRDINSLYSYNLWGFDLSPDRHDAKNVYDVYTDLGRTWTHVTDLKMIEYFLEANRNQVNPKPPFESMASMSVWSMGFPHNSTESYEKALASHKATWQQAFLNVFGKNAVLRTGGMFDSETAYLGFKSISISSDILDVLTSVLYTDKRVVMESQERLGKMKILKDAELTPIQLLHLELARIICQDIRYGSKAFAAIIPSGSLDVITDAAWDTVDKTAYFALSTLSTGSETVNAVVHEMAHAVSGKEDLSAEHFDAATQIAAKIFRSVSQGKYDKILKDPKFIWER